jgi:hypothetical protein
MRIKEFQDFILSQINPIISHLNIIIEKQLYYIELLNALLFIFYIMYYDIMYH